MDKYTFKRTGFASIVF